VFVGDRNYSPLRSFDNSIPILVTIVPPTISNKKAVGFKTGDPARVSTPWAKM